MIANNNATRDHVALAQSLMFPNASVPNPKKP